MAYSSDYTKQVLGDEYEPTVIRTTKKKKKKKQNLVTRTTDKVSSTVNEATKKVKSTTTTSKKSSYVDEVLSDDYAPTVFNVTKRTVNTSNSGRTHGGGGFDSVTGRKTITSAPIKKQDKWFTSGAFEDGWQAGDLTKTILGTGGDILTNAVKGVFSLGEGIGDTVVYLGAAGADAIGQDQLAKDLRQEASVSLADKYFAPAEEFYDKNSILGEKSDRLGQTLGNVAGIVATGGMGKAAGLGSKGLTALTTGTTLTSGFGSGTSEAYLSGATDEEAYLYGLISGTVEAGTEMLFGGLGKGLNATGFGVGLSSADDMFAKYVSKNFKNQTIKNVTEYVIKSGAEGLEEVIAGTLQAGGKKLTYKSDEDLIKLLEEENLMEQFLYGAMASGIMQTGVMPGTYQGSLIDSTKQGKDFVTGYTQNEQAVVDKEIENRIAEKEEDGKKLTSKEKKAIKEEVIEDLENGYISIDSIENTLKGNNTELSDNDAYLHRSYREEYNRSQPFKRNETEVTDNKNIDEFVTSMENANVNNSKKTHDFTSFVSNVIKDKGIKARAVNYDILVNEGKLYKDADGKYKFILNGEKTQQVADINGFKENGVLNINMQSTRAFEKTVGHEIGEFIKDSDANVYEDIKTIAIELGKIDGTYTDSTLENYVSAYGELTDDATDEYVNDKLGELWENDQFVAKLSQKPTILKKIIAEVKHLIKMATTGSKEQRKLLSLQHKLENAVLDAYQKTDLTNQENGTKYSVGGKIGMENAIKADSRNIGLKEQYEEAIQQSKNKVKNEDIRVSTGWFQDKNGDWKFEFSDNKARIIKNPQKNTTYKLSDILKHDELYMLYPETKDIEVITKDMEPNASFNKRLNRKTKELKGGRINVNNSVIDNYSTSDLKKTLLHEVQHYIQAREGFEGGASYKKGLRKYVNSLGEIEAVDTSIRAEMTPEQREAIAPESSKAKPVHPQRDEILAQMGKFEKRLDKLYNLFRGETSEDSFGKIDSLDKRQDNLQMDSGFGRSNNQGEELDNSSFFNTDNQGRKLTKEQQDFFKDSKARDENGNLLTMYHGTNSDFNIFKRGKKGYLGGGIYLTDSKNFAEKYTDYGMVKEVYLDVKQPLTVTSNNPTKEILNAIYGSDRIYNNRSSKQANDTYIITKKDLDKLQSQGYDGVIWKFPSGNEYMVFNSNQIKNVDNTKPTSNPDIRYSLNVDTQGRTLSDKQKEYFKDVVPELKDENGNLKVLYHGSPNQFTQFSYDYIGSNGTALGKGFYLTDSFSMAEGFAGNGNKPMELYANITKPMSLEELTISKSEFKKFVSEIAKQDEYWIYDYGDADREGFNKVLNYAVDLNYDNETNDVDLIHGILNTSTLGWEEGFRVLKETLGYDGVIKHYDAPIDQATGESNVYVPFFPEQIKSVNNQNPTNDLDINLSLGTENDIAPIKNPNLTYAEDVRLEVEEAIAPLKQEIAELKEVFAPVKEQVTKQVEYTQPTKEELANLMSLQEKGGTEYANTFFGLRDKYGQANLYKGINQYKKAPDTYIAPIKGEQLDTVADSKAITEADLPMLERQYEEDFKHIDESSIPEEVEDIAPVREDAINTTKSLFETRNYEDVGNTKTKAYMYENPEVKPFFQQEAQYMLNDLKNSTKGEKWYNDELYYETSGEQGYFGTSRMTTDDIAELLDGMDGRFKYTREQLEKGLNAIIKDNGAENNAVSKRIEFYLDQRLREGYTNIDGIEIPANPDYINMLEEKQVTEYSEEAYQEWLKTLEDVDIPVENVDNSIEEIAPIKKPKETIAEIRPSKNSLDEHGYELLKVKDISKQQQATNEEIAEILDTEPKTENDRNKRKWAILKANVFDKGAVIEDLALKKNNRELMGKWDFTLTSEARGQNIIGKGHFRFDPATKQKVQTSKSLNDIVQEVGNTGLTKQFYEYMYHKHNIDRMTLEERFGTENKAVIGDSVTAQESRKVVSRYETQHPEFMDFAQDVYDYLNADKQELVDNGVISQEASDLWQEMYPHYVPIRRVTDKGLDINVPLDTGRTGINAPVKQATGGNADILPLFDTMAMRTLQTQRATAKNSFGIELKNTLGADTVITTPTVDEAIDMVETQDELLQEGKKGAKPTFTVFENGEKVTFTITKDMYDAMKPLSDSSLLSKTIKPLNVASNFRRGLITEYNPVFMLTNAIKDAQDVFINSQHSARTYANIPEAYAQILSKGYWYQEYVANGGEQNSYFDNQENTFKPEAKGFKKVISTPFRAISAVNNFIEMTPRLAEYMASRKQGKSVEVSMLDAARVTTNFKAGGDVTKFLNRNGATFLNASVQGLNQQVRNFREANANGFKGWVKLAAKFTAAGLPALILNNLIWEDDEEYEELSDYVKQNYYIVGKYGDGKFIRIPKGRTVAVIQNGFEQMENLATGDDEADFDSFFNLVINNLAPNNPIEENVFAPIIQVANNKAWYGGELVPKRLQNRPVEEQYDESTDIFSRWIGETFGVSPYKVNYLLDQYSGGVGDVVLPMLTPEAENGDDSLTDKLLAPIKDKFTTDSVMNNQNVSDFYDTSEKLAIQANKTNATDEDILKSKYINSVNAEMNELYQQKREIQNSSLPDSEKYEQAREIQRQINYLAENALSEYENGTIYSHYAKVGDRHYRIDDNGEWNKITDKQLEKQVEVTNSLGISNNEYWKKKEEYDYAYKNPGKYAISQAVGDYETYKSYTSDIYDIKADKDSNGKSISGSRKKKVVKYINSLDLSVPQKAILIRQEYPSFDDYNYQIVKYVNGLDISRDEKIVILEELGMKVNSKGNISW